MKSAHATLNGQDRFQDRAVGEGHRGIADGAIHRPQLDGETFFNTTCGLKK